ncbi:MAG: tail fiber domain-containing protein [Thermomicrobiales bacterium]
MEWTNRSNVTALGAFSDVTGDNQVQLGDSRTQVYAYGSAINFRSDARDKADIRDTELGLEFIAALRPVDFRWDYREDYLPARPESSDPAALTAYRQEVERMRAARASGADIRDGSRKRTRFHHGFVAQEVRDVLKERSIDFGGYQDHAVLGGDDVLSLGYDEFIAPLVRAVQEQQAQIRAHREEVVALRVVGTGAGS